MKKSLLTLSVVLGLTGCSHMQAKEMHHSHNHVQTPPSESASGSITAESFINSPDLSPGQKAQLKSIYGRVFAQSRMYRAELVEAKSKMFQTLATRDYKSNEISKLKKEIISIDQKRLDLMFGALAEVQGVVGYGEDKEKIYRQLRDYDRHQSDYRMNIE
jgi:hypothetical protein